MSVYYRLVLHSICRSNHHRIAVMALEHLQVSNAEKWRKLFLHHQQAYLEGAKAPDTVCKDFRNHVLHVRDDNWGGAPQAAAEWYRRTVRALKQNDWKHAAYCAGVMSHYVCDPVQPFHTGQTEEENTIHRAVEWSFSKAFPELYQTLETEVGYPDIEIGDDNTWLEDVVCAGAAESNQYYETVVDHYNFEVGHKRPEAGLDQELKDVVAGLLGYATVLLARVLDRAFDEAAAAPPNTNLVLDTLFAAVNTPIRKLLKALEDDRDRDVVEAQYKEFRRTGKVRETLGEDDKVVRALHAEEVLGVSLATLDCQWPRETGTAHGEGAPTRKPAKRQKKPAAEATQSLDDLLGMAEPEAAERELEADAAVAAEDDPSAEVAEEVEAETVDAEPETVVALAPQDTARADADALEVYEDQDDDDEDELSDDDDDDIELEADGEPDDEADLAHEYNEPLEHSDDAERDAERDAAREGIRNPTELRRERIRLRREDLVVDAPSIGPKTASRLLVVGVKTVADLLELAPHEAAKKIKASHINAQVIRDWQSQALLACTVPGISGTIAQMLVGAGVYAPEDMLDADAEFLHEAILDFCDTKEGQRLLRDNDPPDRDQVEEWIDAAISAIEDRDAA